MRMRRVDIAKKLADAAHAAERRGEHGRAAELFANALKVLIGRPAAELAQATEDELRVWLERQLESSLQCRERTPPPTGSIEVDLRKAPTPESEDATEP